MKSNELIFQPVHRLSQLIQNGELSSEVLMRGLIQHHESVDPQVGAFLSSRPQEAIELARQSDLRRSKGQQKGPLDGIPVGIKDNLAVQGHPLTCASKILENFVSPYTATCVERLEQAGMIPWGRLNLDEFAMGASCEHSAFKKTANPWNLDYVPGGSSGGSAAAVASGQVPVSIGSDTGGSIRQPASFCGLVGLKPTYGRVSRYGLAAFASSLDQLGPFGRCAEDVALLMGVMAGHDPRDATSEKTPVPDYVQAMKDRATRKGRIGVPKEYFAQGLDDQVRELVSRAIDFYAKSGFEIVEVTLPRTELAVATYYVIATAEASSNLARYDGVRYTHRSERASDTRSLFELSRSEGFGEEVKRRILLGTYVLSSGYYDAYYVRAQKIRHLIYQDFMNVFQAVDVLMGPTSPIPPFKKGSRIQDPLAMYLCDVYTTSVNLAGLPGLSLPCGLSSEGLPVGLQLIGKPFHESDLLGLAYLYEQAHSQVAYPFESANFSENRKGSQ